MHVFEWLNYTEVVDPDTGAPVAPGEEGEIVLTNLDIQGSPVLRFSTRDRGRWFPHDACDCGRPWHCIEAGGVGRYDDMLKIRGNNVWPLTVDQVVFAHPEVAEYAGRVFVDGAGRTEVEIRLALKAAALGLAPAAQERLLAALRDGIKERTNVQMQLRVVPAAELPQYLYKARRWTDERKSGYAAKT
jgi:phenylacetate-CoA ligase